MTLSIGLATRNRPNRLRAWLTHIGSIDGGAVVPVCIVDQSDHPFPGPLPANVHYTHAPGRGLSRARNAIIAQAGTTFVCFCDDDCFPDPNWLTVAQQLVTTDPSVALWYGQTRPSGAVYTVHTHHTPSGTQHWAQRSDGWVCHALRLSDTPFVTAHPCGVLEQLGQGNNCIVAVAVARQHGGYRTFLGAGSPAHAGEDVEYTLRLLHAGVRCGYAPALRVTHDAWQQPAAAARHAAGYTVGMVTLDLWYAWYGDAVARADLSARLGIWRAPSTGDNMPTPVPVVRLIRLLRTITAITWGGVLGLWYVLTVGRPWR